jgi:hypothetical protein
MAWPMLGRGGHANGRLDTTLPCTKRRGCQGGMEENSPYAGSGFLAFKIR